FTLIYPRTRPRSNLLHYTTLFRSPMDKGVQSLTKSSGVLVSRGAGKLTERVSPFRRNGRTQQRRKVSLKELSYQLSQRERRCPLDRKSTRLNSSHQIISYAVFCLK